MVVQKKCRSSFIYSRVSNLSLPQVYDVLFKDSLNIYRPKNSRIIDIEAVKSEQSAPKKGAIFVVQNKQHFRPSGTRGIIVTSLEALEDNKYSTHFTPNVYRTYSYINKNGLKHKPRLIKGFQDQNLRQINTFVVDIDTKKHSLETILLYCQENFIKEPTMIVSTDRGYHLYFILEKAWFISNENEYLTLKMAKVIAKNIKSCFKDLDADRFCNDFGFFRNPTEDNIVYFDYENTFSMDTLINWSMRFSDDQEQIFLFNHVKKAVFSPSDLNNQEWFQTFIRIRDIKGEKGVMGRNSHLFTIALLLYSRGWIKEEAFNLLDEINSNYSSPLKNKEVQSLLRSAYSGKYKGANKESIQNILDLYADTIGMSAEERKEKLTIRLGNGYWYKFKKDRKDRVRSHLEEWEKDIEAYLTDKFSSDSPFIWHTQKELCDVVRIPQSTLNKLIKSSKKIIKVVQGKGCKAETGWSTVELCVRYIQLKKAKYTLLIRKMVEELIEIVMIEAAENPAKKEFKQKIIYQKIAGLDIGIPIEYLKTG